VVHGLQNSKASFVGEGLWKLVWQKLDSRFFSFFSQLIFSFFPFFWERIHGNYTLLPSIPLKVYMTDMVPVRN
jgi:hypothetical protein